MTLTCRGNGGLDLFQQRGSFFAAQDVARDVVQIRHARFGIDGKQLIHEP